MALKTPRNKNNNKTPNTSHFVSTSVCVFYPLPYIAQLAPSYSTATHRS